MMNDDYNPTMAMAELTKPRRPALPEEPLAATPGTFDDDLVEGIHESTLLAACHTVSSINQQLRCSKSANTSVQGLLHIADACLQAAYLLEIAEDRLPTNAVTEDDDDIVFASSRRKRRGDHTGVRSGYVHHALRQLRKARAVDINAMVEKAGSMQGADAETMGTFGLAKIESIIKTTAAAQLQARTTPRALSPAEELESLTKSAASLISAGMRGTAPYANVEIRIRKLTEQLNAETKS